MNPDAFYRAAMRMGPGRIEPLPPPTRLQQEISAAVGEWLKLNALVQALGTVPAAAPTILAECETAMLRAAAHFAEARRLVAAGEPIVPGEGGARG